MTQHGGTDGAGHHKHLLQWLASDVGGTIISDGGQADISLETSLKKNPMFRSTEDIGRGASLDF